MPLQGVARMSSPFCKSRLRCLQHIDTKQKILKPKKRLPHKIHRKPVTELAFALPR